MYVLSVVHICVYEDACYVSVCCCDVCEFYSGVHHIAMTPCEGQQCALYMTQQWQTHNNTQGTLCGPHWHCMNGRHSPFNQSPNVFTCVQVKVSVSAPVWFLESLLHTCVVSGNHLLCTCLVSGNPYYVCVHLDLSSLGITPTGRLAVLQPSKYVAGQR